MAGDALSLRPLAESDCDLVFAWANDPLARRMSMSTGPIARDEHERWFASRLSDPSCLFWIATRSDGEPVAQVRLDLGADRSATISVSVAPAWRGRGYGTEVIRLAAREARSAGGIGSIHAYLKPENAASARAFASAGFGPSVPVLYEGTPVLRMSLALEEQRP